MSRPAGDRWVSKIEFPSEDDDFEIIDGKRWKRPRVPPIHPLTDDDLKDRQFVSKVDFPSEDAKMEQKSFTQKLDAVFETEDKNLRGMQVRSPRLDLYNLLGPGLEFADDEDYELISGGYPGVSDDQHEYDLESLATRDPDSDLYDDSAADRFDAQFGGGRFGGEDDLGDDLGDDFDDFEEFNGDGFDNFDELSDSGEFGGSRFADNFSDIDSTSGRGTTSYLSNSDIDFSLLPSLQDFESDLDADPYAELG